MAHLFTTQMATVESLGRQRNAVPLSLQKSNYTTPLVLAPPYPTTCDSFSPEEMGAYNTEKAFPPFTPNRTAGGSNIDELPAVSSTDMEHCASFLPLKGKGVSSDAFSDALGNLKKDSLMEEAKNGRRIREGGSEGWDTMGNIPQGHEENEEDEGKKKKRTRGLPNEEEPSKVKMVRKTRAAADKRVKDVEGRWPPSEAEENVQARGNVESNAPGNSLHRHYEEGVLLSPEQTLDSPASKRYRISTGSETNEKKLSKNLYSTTSYNGVGEVSIENAQEITPPVQSHLFQPLVEKDGTTAPPLPRPSSHIQEMYKNLEHLGKEWEDVCAAAGSVGLQGAQGRSRRMISLASRPTESRIEVKRIPLETEKLSLHDTSKDEPERSSFYSMEKPQEEEEGREEKRSTKLTLHMHNEKEYSTNASLPSRRDGDHGSHVTPPSPCHRRSMEGSLHIGKEEQKTDEVSEEGENTAGDTYRLSEPLFFTPYRQHREGRRRVVGGNQGAEKTEEDGSTPIGGVGDGGEYHGRSAVVFSPPRGESADVFVSTPEGKAASTTSFPSIEYGGAPHACHPGGPSTGGRRGSTASNGDPEGSALLPCTPVEGPTSQLLAPPPCPPLASPVAPPSSVSSDGMLNSAIHPRQLALSRGEGTMRPISSLRPLPLTSTSPSEHTESSRSKRVPSVSHRSPAGENGQLSYFPHTTGLPTGEEEAGHGGIISGAAGLLPAPRKVGVPVAAAAAGRGAGNVDSSPVTVSLPTPPSSLTKRTRDGRIKVVVRKRPLMPGEMGIDCVTVASPHITLEVTKQRVDLSSYQQKSEFSFDAVFSEEDHNEDVYKNCTQELLELAMEGGSASCFAYGQTGSGKTHTMIGSDKERGLYLLAVSDLFKRLLPTQRLSASFYEIYCNSLFDLLNGRAPVVLREGGDRRVNICGLTWHPVDSVESLVEMVTAGMEQRRTGSTSANEQSSRSHAILSIRISRTESSDFQGVMNFVDLAGSERAADTATNDKQTRLEGAEINKSLLALKECIRALDERRKHVPFRGSRLTEVLRDSFTGNSKTVMITNVSPSSINFDHTANALRYAFRVKGLSIPTVAPDRARNAPRPFVPRVASYNRFRTVEAHSCPARRAAEETPSHPFDASRISTSSLANPALPSSSLPHSRHSSSMNNNLHKRYAYSTVSDPSRPHSLPPSFYQENRAGMSAGEAGAFTNDETDDGRVGHSFQDRFPGEYNEDVSDREKKRGSRLALHRPVPERIFPSHYPHSASTKGTVDGGSDRKNGADRGASSFTQLRPDISRMLSLSSGPPFDMEGIMESNTSLLQSSEQHYPSRYSEEKSNTTELDNGEHKPRRRHRRLPEHTTNELLQRIFRKKKKDPRRERESSEEGVADRQERDDMVVEKEYGSVRILNPHPSQSNKRRSSSPRYAEEEECAELEELKQRLLRRVIRKVQRDLGREIQFILDERDQIISELREENKMLRRNIEVLKGNETAVITLSSTHGVKVGGVPNTSPSFPLPSSEAVPCSSSISLPVSPPVVKLPTPLHYRPLSSHQTPVSGDWSASYTSSRAQENSDDKNVQITADRTEDQKYSVSIEEEI